MADGRPCRRRPGKRHATGARRRGSATGPRIPRIINVKNTPMESTWAEFWNVVFMPLPAPRCWAGRLFITAARFGERSRRSDAAEEEDPREHHVDKVDREEGQEDKGHAGNDHPAGREGP